jgi:hypothetical protein
VWTLAAAEPPLSAAEKARIEGLLKRISELKDAEFVRNGRAYAPAEAVKFFRGNLEKMGAGVTTAEQFKTVARKNAGMHSRAG